MLIILQVPLFIVFHEAITDRLMCITKSKTFSHLATIPFHFSCSLPRNTCGRQRHRRLGSVTHLHSPGLRHSHLQPEPPVRGERCKPGGDLQQRRLGERPRVLSSLHPRPSLSWGKHGTISIQF